MDEEDLEPRRKKPAPKPLDGLSVEELQGYIADLRAEIARAEAVIKAKQAHRSGAESLFRK
jgi:uncharacterized small protein (DUF1192 family)